ncbi:PolC-type DNA polymerase III [Marinobacter sp. JSM 1782161]|uniref:3'-5' exonuclease n=1 Tax=Marinobacter sp. JSM 1782161 TaxID=2685906 RepID=UPI00140331C6|nr:3'-5' exonuclease [Marinobacter sp. JSM 1782161]
MFDRLKHWFSQVALKKDAGKLDPAHLPTAKRAGDTPFGEQRLIVLDLETTGLNTGKDQVIAIGAVAIDGLSIPLRDQFDLVLRRPELDIRETVLIHGIGPEALTRGHETEEALLRLLLWMDGDPVLAFHADFDRRFLERTLKTQLGYGASHTWLDVAEILPALFPGALPDKARLDDWVDHFALEVSERHHAAADAMATAELALIALHYARRQGIESLGQLEHKLRVGRRLKSMKSH